jgi:ABC-2 type transport system permease protein
MKSTNHVVWRFESVALWREPAFRLLVAILVAAVVLAILNGVRWVHFQQDAIERLLAEDVASLGESSRYAADIAAGREAPPRGYWANPADVRGFAYYLMVQHAIKPPSPLSALTVGQGDLLPYYFKVDAGSRLGEHVSYELENPRRLLLGRFDLTFVVLFLLPLAILAAGYGVLSSEREDGRLALLQIHGITPVRLALVRLTLRAVVLLAAVFVAGAITLWFCGIEFVRAEGLAAWIGVALAYSAFWLALTLIVVSIAKTSASAALSLAAMWIGLAVLAPWAVNLAANTLHPLPSRAEFILAQRSASDVADGQRAQLLGRYLHDHPELASANATPETMHATAYDIASRVEIERALAPVRARHEEQLDAQQRVGRWQWLLPAVLAQQAMNDLSGTGWIRHRFFLQKVDDYVLSLRRFFDPPVLRGEYAFTEFDLWPRYRWQEPPIAFFRNGLQSALVGLLLPAALLGGFAVMTLRRKGRSLK